MEGQDIRGLVEAYSQVYEIPEVLNEGVEQIDEAPMTAFQAAGGNAKLAQLNKGRSPRSGRITARDIEATGRENLYRAGGGDAAIAKGPTRTQNTRGGGQIKVPTLTRQDIINRGTVAKPAKPTATPPAPTRPGSNTPAPTRPGSNTPAPAKPSAAPAKPTNSQKPTAPTAPQKPAGSAMDQWRAANPKLANKVNPDGTQKGTGQSQMSRQAAELRDMQKASQMRQKGADAMGSNITSVRQDLEKANKPENLNKPAPAGTALERQQKMTALKKPSADLKFEHLDIFDIVKGHLLDEGYAETEENALVIMANMSEEWRDSIIEAQRARENPEDHDKEEKRKYEPVRGEKTPMPPRGDKRREAFEKWYAANVR
jgi:hypothetical protein